MATITGLVARHDVITSARAANAPSYRSEAGLIGAPRMSASEPERVFDRREIMRHLWESDFVGDLGKVNVHVRNLRRKIERTPEAPERLVSVPSIGYQLLPV